MPMKLNIGLSRKIGEANYGSRGASVNVEVEVEGSLVTEPTKLQEHIRRLFGLVRASITEELNGGAGANGNAHLAVTPAETGNGDNVSTNSNAATNGNRARRLATQSQVRAIEAIARKQRLNLGFYLADHHGVVKPEDLSIQEASQAIDELKKQPTRG